MSYIRFEFLDDLLAFLRACEENETKLGRLRDRSLYTNIHLSRGDKSPVYGLSVDNSNKIYVENEFLYGGKFIDNAEAQGNIENINFLLKRLPLRSRQTQSNKIPALVFAIRLAGITEVDAQQLIHAAWRDIPRQQDSTSKFYMCTEADKPTWLAVHVDAVEPWFSYDQWIAKYQHSGIVLFLPPEDCEDLRYLFVQWGFEYPKAEEFYLLYDAGMNADALLLCLAGDQLQQNGWFMSEWLIIKNRQIGFRSNAIWQITGDAPTVHDLSGDNQPQEGMVELKLAIGDTLETLGSLSQLDQRISIRERELEDLHARRNRIKSSFYREFVPIYEFRSDNRNGALPADLVRFLSRPLGELAMYQYLHTEKDQDGADVHYIIGKNSVALAAALSVPCSFTYLQDRRWIDWELPLFVRYGCSLSLDIEEEEMAKRLWDIMQNAQVPDNAKAILALPGDKKVDNLYSLDLKVLPEGQDLDQCLAYVNAGGGVPEVMSLQGLQTITQVTRSYHLEVPPELAEAMLALHKISQTKVDEAENKWEEIRQKTRALLFDARVTDAALEITRQAYELAPGSWEEFVRRVVDIDEQIAKLKLDAMERWTVSEGEREVRLKNLDDSYSDTNAEVASKTEEFQRKLETLKQQEADLMPEVAKIEELKRALLQEQQRVMVMQRTLDKEIATTELLASSIQNEVAKTQRKIAQRDAASERVDMLKQEIEQLADADLASVKQLEMAISDAKKLAAYRRIDIKHKR